MLIGSDGTLYGTTSGGGAANKGTAFKLVGATVCSVNGVKDGLETDVDCGGPVCQACVAGQKCLVGSDCQSGACNNGICSSGVPATCSDGIKDGLETDVDCGGPVCVPCSAGKQCKLPRDCQSGLTCRFMGSQGVCLP